MKYSILTIVSMVSQVQPMGLHITHPKEIIKALDLEKSNGYIEVGFGLQGHVDYGSGFTGELFYPTSN